VNRPESNKLLTGYLFTKGVNEMSAFRKKVKSRHVFWMILLLLSIALLSYGMTATNAATPKKKTITDDAGRKVSIPTTIKKTYSTSPVGTIFMYTLAPKKLRR
jgi:hypothetical protein